MRVSSNMIADRVVFNMQRSLRRFFELQTQMSTGRRINKPSDDPLGTLRDLDYRKELARIGQYQSNISAGLNWQGNYDSALADLGNIMSTANELAISMGNDDKDAAARRTVAGQVDDLIESFLQIANSDLGSKSLFSGYKTNRDAFSSYANGVVYRGDFGKIEFDIESSSRLQINMNGADVFLKELSILGADADLNIGVTGATLLTSLNNGGGVDLTTGGTPGTIVLSDRNLGINSTIDLSAAVTMTDVINTINAQLAADGINDVIAKLGPNNNEIMFDTTASGEITNATSLSVLNDGNGIDMQPGKLVVSDGGAINVEVDLSGASTIGDVITQFNAAMAAAAPPAMANVSIGLNAAGTGFEITDTNGVPLNLNIWETDKVDTTAADLGIAGPVDPVLTGDDLNPTVSFEITETTGTTAADLGILGEFFLDFLGSDLDPQLLATTNLSQLNLNSGFTESEIIIHHGEATRTFDLSDPGLVTVQDFLDAINNSGLDITASFNSSGRGIQIRNDDPIRSLLIEDVDGGRLTKDMGIYGSSDMMGSLIALSNALYDNDAEGIRSLIGNLGDSITQLLDNRATAGARAMRLEATSARLTDSEIGYTTLLANVEDADMSKLITDLATFENNYQASLMAVAKIIQPSLLNFLK